MISLKLKARPKLGRAVGKARPNLAAGLSVGGTFQHLAHFLTRRPWLVIGFWLLLVAMLSGLPPVMIAARQHTTETLPSNAPVLIATHQMTKAFHEPAAQNVALVVLTDDHGMTSADEDVYRKLVDKLRGDTRDVNMVQDFISKPPLREVMASKDNKAWFIPVGIAGELGSPTSDKAYERVVDIVKKTVKQAPAGSRLTVHMTGLTATAADLARFAERDLQVIETGTLVAVLLILIVVYRNLVTILLPLATIGISQAAAAQIVSGLAQLGLGISQQTVVFMSAMMIGAGVDYAVFLISRYHESLRRGMDSDEAIARALAAIGKVIAASAATVAVTFLGMSFTTLSVFSTIGPALAVSIVVAFFAAITLLPAMLVIAGRRGWVGPKKDLTKRFWRRSGVHIVRRPVAHLLGSLVVLIALASCVAVMHTSYDARTTLPPLAESNVGYSAIEHHFPASSTIPEYVFIQSSHDLRSSMALADLEQLAQRIAEVPNVALVRGITRPTGAPLEQATLSFQAGEIGSKLADASSKIAGSSDARDALTGGSRKLADSLSQVRGQLTRVTGVLEGLSNTLSAMKTQLAGSQAIENVNVQLAGTRSAGNSVESNAGDLATIHDMASVALDSMNGSPGCAIDPSCSKLRDQLQRLVDMLQRVQPSLEAAAKSMQRLGLTDPGGLQQGLSTIDQGAAALANGSRQIAEGVRQLDDQTTKLGEGLSRASAFLLAMKLNASQPGASGFYFSPEILGNDQFKDLARVFMSPDGHAVRYLVQSKLDPYDTKAMDQVKSILAAARGAQANTSLADAKISMSGLTPYYSEMRDYYNQDLRFIILMTVAVVFSILVLLLRAIVAPLYLVGTVILSYLSSLGIGVVVMQLIGGQPMAATVPGMAFIVLVAVGADYNMLLISRIRDESPRGIRSGVIRTVGTTGSVITSAGIIFAAPMFAMLFSSISSMVQAGFVIGVGLLLDTFVVRTVTAPALAVLFGRANWWPSGWRRRQRSTKVPGTVPATAEAWPGGLWTPWTESRWLRQS